MLAQQLARLQAVGLGLCAMRLEQDLERVMAHVNDGDPAVRRHAREWRRQLEAEQCVLGRWQSELLAIAPRLTCSREVCS